jgi:hypothetical protein
MSYHAKVRDRSLRYHALGPIGMVEIPADLRTELYELVAPVIERLEADGLSISGQSNGIAKRHAITFDAKSDIGKTIHAVLAEDDLAECLRTL